MGKVGDSDKAVVGKKFLVSGKRRMVLKCCFSILSRVLNALVDSACVRGFRTIPEI